MPKGGFKALHDGTVFKIRRTDTMAISISGYIYRFIYRCIPSCRKNKTKGIKVATAGRYNGC